MGESFAHGHALIIGTGEGIENVIDDAHGLAALLQDSERCAYPAAQVQTLTGADATRAAILRALDALARATSADSTVIVYFSGHGYEALTPSGRDYYLLPSDAREDQLSTTTLHGSEFVARLAAIPAQKMLILLDCCHAGGLDAWEAAAQLTKAPMPPEARDLLAKGAGRVLIASSRAHEVSFAAGRGEPYSKFTAALLEALCGEGNARRDGFVRVADLALYASEEVPARTRHRQHPLLNFEHADNFAVAYYASGDARPKALPFARPHEPPPGQAFPRRIPAPPLDFTGREADLRQWLSEADHQRGFVLHGLGGAGKSALAFRLAEALAPRYPNAQLYVDLQDKHRKPLTPVQAMTLVIRAFRPDFVAGRAPPERLSELYRDCLSDGGHLLLFDNARSEKQLDLLMEAKDCFILVTSHRRLALRGMLSCPVDVLPPAQARALLLKIAPRLGEQAEAVAEACGYMPYALCLTASRLQQRPNLDPADYARRLRDWSQQLDLVPASLTETYRQLSKARQAQFCALAAFPREFDQTAAEMALDLSAAAVMEALGELVECHLLEWNPAARPYHLHDAARAFAHSQKNARPDVIRRLRGVMKSKNRPEATRRAAGLWLTRLRWLDDVTTVPLGEFVTYLDFALQGTDSSTGLGYLERHITSALRRFDATLSPKHRAKLLVDRAALRGQLHRLDEAEKDYQAASKLAGNSGPPAARIALGLANIIETRSQGWPRAERQPALREALGWYETAQQAATASDDVVLKVSIGQELTYTHGLLHEWGQAEAQYTAALALLEQHEQELGADLYIQRRAMLLETATNLHFENGANKRPRTGPAAQREYEIALHFAEEEIALLSASGLETDALAMAYENTGDCLLALSQCEGGATGQREAACEKWQRAADIAGRLGIRDITEKVGGLLQKHCTSQTAKRST